MKQVTQDTETKLTTKIQLLTPVAIVVGFLALAGTVALVAIQNITQQRHLAIEQNPKIATALSWLRSTPAKSASVIVRIKTPYAHLLENNQNKSDFTKKLQQFAIAKKTVTDKLRGKNAKVGNDLPIINGFIMTADEVTLETLAQMKDVVKVYPNGRYRTLLNVSTAENDPPQASALKDVGNVGVVGTGAGTRIAIIDTGIDYTHPDFGSCTAPFTDGSCEKIPYGWDFSTCEGIYMPPLCEFPKPEGPDPMDMVNNGHGTHVAAVAAGNGALQGVAQDAKIFAYKAFNTNGVGSYDWIISAIYRAIDPNQDGNTNDHADVINMSFGIPVFNVPTPDDAVADTIEIIGDIGAVFVISSGDFGPRLTDVWVPAAASPSSIAVSAGCTASQIQTESDCETGVATSSPRGGSGKPDLVAPGVKICAAKAESDTVSSTCLDSRHSLQSGSSDAAAYVSGVAALLKQLHPEFTQAQVKDRLKTTAHDLGQCAKFQGAGMVDIHDAVY